MRTGAGVVCLGAISVESAGRESATTYTYHHNPQQRQAVRDALGEIRRFLRRHRNLFLPSQSGPAESSTSLGPPDVRRGQIERPMRHA